MGRALRAPKTLPILNPSNFVPENGFSVVQALRLSVSVTQVYSHEGLPSFIALQALTLAGVRKTGSEPPWHISPLIIEYAPFPLRTSSLTKSPNSEPHKVTIRRVSRVS